MTKDMDIREEFTAHIPNNISTYYLKERQKGRDKAQRQRNKGGKLGEGEMRLNDPLILLLALPI